MFAQCTGRMSSERLVLVQCLHMKSEFRKASAGTVFAQHASVVSIAVCVAPDQSTSPKSVKEVKVSVPVD